MKNYLKLIIPAMLLLIATSAFAQENLTTEEIKTQLVSTLSNEYNKVNTSIVDTVNAICKGNKYCNANALLLFYTTPADQKEEIKAKLIKETDHKQALYNTKYELMYKPYGENFLNELESYKISRLQNIEELYDYTCDVPLTSSGVAFATTRIAELLFTTNNPNKFEVLKSLIESELTEFTKCSKDLPMLNEKQQSVMCTTCYLLNEDSYRLIMKVIRPTEKLSEFEKILRSGKLNI